MLKVKLVSAVGISQPFVPNWSFTFADGKSFLKPGHIVESPLLPESIVNWINLPNVYFIIDSKN